MIKGDADRYPLFSWFFFAFCRTSIHVLQQLRPRFFEPLSTKDSTAAISKMNDLILLVGQ